MIADRGYFAVARSKAEPLALMVSCNIFVLISTCEGLPHTVVKAQPPGFLVVATAVGGTTEVVQD